MQADRTPFLDVLPPVMQYNQQALARDLILGVPELQDSLDLRHVSRFAADALHGLGVLATTRCVAARVLHRLSRSTPEG